ncbi:MAG: hypothetical protein GX801_06400 [Fibrobacter sp.]|nr:hypothetical protein [Fibrobacter sp.]
MKLLRRMTMILIFINGLGWTEVPWEWEVEDGRIHASELADLLEEEKEAWEAEMKELRSSRQKKYGQLRSVWVIDSGAALHSKQWQAMIYPLSWLEFSLEGDTLPQEYYGKIIYKKPHFSAEILGGYWKWRALKMKWPWFPGWGGAFKLQNRHGQGNFAGVLDSNYNLQLHSWWHWRGAEIAGYTEITTQTENAGYTEVSGHAEIANRAEMAEPYSAGHWGVGAGYAYNKNLLRLWFLGENWDLWLKSQEQISLWQGKLLQKTDLKWLSDKKLEYKSTLNFTKTTSWTKTNSSTKTANCVKNKWQYQGEWRWARLLKNDAWQDEFRYRFYSQRTKGDYKSRWELRGLWPSVNYQGIVWNIKAEMPSSWEAVFLGAFQWRMGENWRNIGLESGIKWRFKFSELTWTMFAPTTKTGLRRLHWRSSFKQKLPWGYFSGSWSIKEGNISTIEVRVLGSF